MSSLQFLTNEWIEAVAALQTEYNGRVPAPAHAMRVNQTISGCPFADEPAVLHMDTTSGSLVLGLGHVDDAVASVATDYATARALFIEEDQQAVMQAFMQGKIRIEGDMAKLMAPPAPKNDAQIELTLKIKALTAL